MSSAYLFITQFSIYLWYFAIEQFIPGRYN